MPTKIMQFKWLCDKCPQLHADELECVLHERDAHKTPVDGDDDTAESTLQRIYDRIMNESTTTSADPQQLLKLESLSKAIYERARELQQTTTSMKMHIDDNLQRNIASESFANEGDEDDDHLSLMNINLANNAAVREHDDDRLDCSTMDANETGEQICGSPSGRFGVKVGWADPRKYSSKPDGAGSKNVQSPVFVHPFRARLFG